MIQPYPPSPTPFYLYLLYFNDQFSTLYISYIFQLKFKLSWPLCIFLTHKNTKSHIIKTHNCCGSIKRELKQKKQFLRQTSSLANVLYISVFTLQPDGESTESLSVLNVWWTYLRPKCNQTGIQNKPFIIPCPLQG